MQPVAILWLLASPAAAPAAPDVDAMARDVLPEVAELRGLAFERDVPVKRVDAAEATRHVRRRLDDLEIEDGLRQAERAYQTLGLLPRGYDAIDALLGVMREQAAGYYDPASGTFYLLDHVPEASARVVMAHELTHALEDQHFDLDGRLRAVLDDDDRLLARSAVHEGSATLLMTLYVLRKVGRGEMDSGALASLAGLAATGALDGMPEVLRRQLLVPYVLGPVFLARGDLAAAVSGAFPIRDVNAAYTDPPESSEQILHPHKYWGEGPDMPQAVDLGDSGSALGSDFALVATGVLGELGIGPLVGAPTPADLGDPSALAGGGWTNASAAGWDGDRWELWQRGDTDVVLLGSVWDTEADAAEFLDAVSAQPRFKARRAGNRVAVVAGATGRRAERALGRVLAATAPPDEPELVQPSAGR